MIGVLIVDDSPFIRVALRKILSKDPEIEVVGEAGNGKEAIKQAVALKPDVITLDINMPIMDGLSALEEIRELCPDCGVLMVSALTKEGAEETMQALSKGAVDFITKPKDYQELFSFGDEIVAKVKAVFYAKRGRSMARSGPKAPPTGDRLHKPFSRVPIVAIGISTGGPQTLSTILPRFPLDFPSPVLIAIHMPDTFTATFARHLDSICKLPVKEADGGEVIKNGHVYVSRGRIHMLISGVPDRAVVVYRQDDSYIYKPSVDLLFESVARVYGSDSIAVVMTGMGNDGSKGVQAIREAGGITIAEDPSTAILWAMPENAIKTGCIDHVVRKDELPALLVKLLSSSP